MDLGGSGVRFLRLGQGEEGVSQWYYPGAIVDQEGEISSFRGFLRANRLAGALVASNIEDTSLRIRRVDLPKMPDYDLKEAVRWQLRDVVEGPVSDYIVRYSVVEEYSVGDVKKLALVAYAIRKSAISRRSEFLRSLSLEPVVIEPTSVSLLAAFDRVQGWQEGEYYGLIDLGETKSVFTVMGEGRLYFSRPLAGVSGQDLKGLLESDLALSPPDSESLKRHLMEGGETGGGADSRLTAMREKVDALLPTLYKQVSLEAQRSIDAFTLMFKKERVHRLFLCGGGASLPGLAETLTKNLAIPTALLDPSAAFRMPPGRSHLFMAALGLALYPL